MMIIKLNHFKVIVPPKRSTYIKCCKGQYKWMCILIEYDDLLKNTVWNKVCTDIKKGFNCKPA